MIFSYCGKKSIQDGTSISDMLEFLRGYDFSISEVMDYPILAIQNCLEGKMLKINDETVIILEFDNVESASKYALAYAGTEKSNKTFAVGKFVIRSEISFDVSKAMKEKLGSF